MISRYTKSGSKGYSQRIGELIEDARNNAPLIPGYHLRVDAEEMRKIEQYKATLSKRELAEFEKLTKSYNYHLA